MAGRLFWGDEERSGELKVERRQEGAMSDVEAVLIEPRGGREGGNFLGGGEGAEADVRNDNVRERGTQENAM
jgi:hypothetical protein